MSGVKGRSGRRSKIEEKTIQDLCDVCKGHLLMRMQDPSTPMDIRDKIALSVAPRLIPNANDISIRLELPQQDRLILQRYGVQGDIKALPHMEEGNVE